MGDSKRWQMLNCFVNLQWYTKIRDKKETIIDGIKGNPEEFNKYLEKNLLRDPRTLTSYMNGLQNTKKPLELI